MRGLLLILLLMAFGAMEVAPVMVMAQDSGQQQQQQPPHRRTLLEMLFGPREPPPPPVQQYVPPKRKVLPPQLPPAKPAIAKAPGATRIAVFGDSLAVDLGKALDRLYADDPNLAVLQQGVGSSGFARSDYFDWNKVLGEQIGANSFDLAVVMIGINDRQTITVDGKGVKPLTDPWNAAYSARLNGFLGALRAAGKPVVWIGLPPVLPPQLSAATIEITALERLASYGNGADFLDVYDRFLDENGEYAAQGPDLNGQQVLIRKSDGVHFTNAGSDKLAFYLGQAIKLFYHGGGVSIDVTDPLTGTDAAAMLRLPYQGVGQIRLLQVAGAVMSLTGTPARSDDLVDASAQPPAPGFDLKQLVDAPTGRADAFGAGVDPDAAVRAATVGR